MFTCGFGSDLQFGSQLQEGAITRPYGHEGLAPGEAQTGSRSDEAFYISSDLKKKRFVKT